MPDVRRLAPGGTPEQVLAGEVGRLRREVDSLKAKLLARIKSGGSGGSWTAPAFENSWTNYGYSYAPAGFLKDADGFVHLRGLVSGGTAGTTAFTLPAGCRPAYDMFWPAFDTGGAFSYVQVFANGQVQPHAALDLAAVTFLAEG